MASTTLHAQHRGTEQHRTAVLAVPRAAAKHLGSVPRRCGARGARDARLRGCCTAPRQHVRPEPSTASCLAIRVEAHEGPSAPATAPWKFPSRARPEGRTNQAPGSWRLGAPSEPPRSHPASCSTRCRLGRGHFGLPCPRLNWPGLPGLVICC